MPPRRAGRHHTAVIAASSIVEHIYRVRGFRVMLDSDLAELYGVPTRTLNQAVSRNASRFPADFAFRLTPLEAANLKSQFVTSSSHGGSRKLPRVFTEQGVAMLSSVLRSRRAIEVNIAIMRAFVHVRELASASADLALRIDEMDQRYDGQFADVFDAFVSWRPRLYRNGLVRASDSMLMRRRRRWATPARAAGHGALRGERHTDH